MQGIIGKLGNNFLVAAFIPSLGFVLLAQLIFSPLIPSLTAPKDIFQSDAFLPLVLTIIIGFTLMSLNTFIYKLVEGYFVLERFSPWKRRQYRKALKRRLEFELIDALINKLLKQNKIEQSKKRKRARRLTISNYRKRSYDLKAQYQQDYPEQLRGVLPTRFGNILKAAELYANENYGIDSVLMWPRLIYVMDPEYYKKVDQSNNGLAFIINCMILSLVLAILSLIAAAYQLCDGCFSLPQANISGWLYVAASNGLILLSVFFYYASLPAARQFSNMVRSSFDLFRFDLLKHLHLPLPQDDSEELALWIRWSEFVALGQFESVRKPFKYVHDEVQAGVSQTSEVVSTSIDDLGEGEEK